MTKPAGRLERLYSYSLRLYPADFQRINAACMAQAFRDALRDTAIPRRELICLLLRDLFISLVKEHLSMLQQTYARPVLLFNALVLAGISSILALALYAIPQQVLRRGADDPQIALADDLVARIEHGIAPADAIPAGSVDMGRSLTPFVIAYDDQGKPLASQALLNGRIPTPPLGVFETARRLGLNKITWRPQAGLYFAAIVQRVEGAHPGFVLAGRSMREVDDREHQVSQMAGLAWIGMLTLIVFGTAIFGWFTRNQIA